MEGGATRWERAWTEREERVYPALFGGAGEGIFLPSAEMFSQAFKVESVDPRWLHMGVLRFAPTPDRPSWLYVTSGLSTEWDDDEPEGLQAELSLETPWRSDDAIRTLLHLMAYNLLLAGGHYGEVRRLEVGSRIHLGASFEAHGAMAGFVVASPRNFPREFELETGPVDLMACLGVTAEEMEFAKAEGSAILADRLMQAGVGTITDPRRPSTI